MIILVGKSFQANFAKEPVCKNIINSKGRWNLFF